MFIKKFLFGISAVAVAFLAYVGFQSPKYEVSREITINAPADKIFPYLNNSKMAEQWAPWPEVDPQVKMTYSGSESGVGSLASWVSDGPLGTGSALIVESLANQKVGTKLEYEKPMKISQYSEYLLRTSGNETIMTWKVQGENSFVGRLMCVFVNMDKMVGGMFEKGLTNLKMLIEKKS